MPKHLSKKLLSIYNRKGMRKIYGKSKEKDRKGRGEEKERGKKVETELSSYWVTNIKQIVVVVVVVVVGWLLHSCMQDLKTRE